MLLTMAVLTATSFGYKEESHNLQNPTRIWNISLSTLNKHEHQEEHPPWVECNSTNCTCRKGLENLRMIQCDTYTHQLSVITCYCVTFDSKTGALFAGKCQENCENGYDKSEYLPLPLNVSKLNKFMCEEKWNRTGRLCGKCLPGHSPLAYSYDMRCVKCPEGNRNIWKYILVAFGPPTIFYFVVLLCRIKANSLQLHGFIIFSQIVSAPPLAQGGYKFFKTHPDIGVPILIIGTMYTMWNLDFFPRTLS